MQQKYYRIAELARKASEIHEGLGVKPKAIKNTARHAGVSPVRPIAAFLVAFFI